MTPRDDQARHPVSRSVEVSLSRRSMVPMPAVESIPGKVSGTWVFKGSRLPVATVIENLEVLSIDEVIEQFDVTGEQVAAILEFVVQTLRVSDVPAGAYPV